MTHYTHTGPYAGVPFCGIDKASARAAGDTFVHVPYAGANYRPSDLCPICAEIWRTGHDMHEASMEAADELMAEQAELDLGVF